MPKSYRKYEGKKRRRDEIDSIKYRLSLALSERFFYSTQTNHVPQLRQIFEHFQMLSFAANISIQWIHICNRLIATAQVVIFCHWRKYLTSPLNSTEFHQYICRELFQCNTVKDYSQGLQSVECQMNININTKH